ncbi:MULTISPECIES: hypothetical protein [unclassified Gilliamella]|uniref:hypothetical protein n=1 Tax=unclassified Gilliamella TaxID=2685620 RepID=UPI001C400BCB|nr:hypothetical protein [Gilliamella apicola]
MNTPPKWLRLLIDENCSFEQLLAKLTKAFNCTFTYKNDSGIAKAKLGDFAIMIHDKIDRIFDIILNPSYIVTFMITEGKYPNYHVEKHIQTTLTNHGITYQRSQAKDHAYPIELPFWQAPNDDIVIKSKGDTLTAYCKIWYKPAKYSKFTGIFEFSNVWAMRFERNKQCAYYSHCDSDDFNSCYWVIPESSWLEQLVNERQSHFPNWQQYDRGDYWHYIIQSHSFYVEVIAKQIKISKKQLKGIF